MAPETPGPSAYETGVVLSGGGARAAYQIGVLRGVAKILARSDSTPFGVISGTSAGAINAAILAAHADSFRRGVARLTRLWRNIEISAVYRADLATVSTHGMRWLSAVLGRTGPVATEHQDRLPTGVRYLMRGLGGTEGSGGNLLSYLLFDRRYCRSLLALGYAEALARRDEIAAFLAGSTAGFLPLFPLELML